MKKSIKYFFTALIASVLFTSCFDPILPAVMQDVAPEESTVYGTITSMARYTIGSEEFYFLAANNGLRYKNASNVKHGAWKTYSESALPFPPHFYDYYGDAAKNPTGKIGHIGQSIIKVMADSDTLYLVTVEYEQDEAAGINCPKQFHVWATQLTAADNKVDETNIWTDLFETVNADNSVLKFYKDTTQTLYFTSFGAFFTNSVKNEHRAAFIRSGDEDDAKIYKLAGTTAVTDLSTLEVAVNASSILDADSTKDIDSAAYIGSNLYFFDSYAVATNETSASDATYAYFSPDSTSMGSKIIKYTNGTETKYAFEKDESGKSSSTELSSKVTSLAVTADSLLIGLGDYSLSLSDTKGGITKTTLDSDGIPGRKTVSFDTNASIQISGYYQVYTMLVADPAKNETETDIYASIGFKGAGTSGAVSYDSVGLWAYYPDRENWNRE